MGRLNHPDKSLCRQCNSPGFEFLLSFGTEKHKILFDFSWICPTAPRWLWNFKILKSAEITKLTSRQFGRTWVCRVVSSVLTMSSRPPSNWRTPRVADPSVPESRAHHSNWPRCHQQVLVETPSSFCWSHRLPFSKYLEFNILRRQPQADTR